MNYTQAPALDTNHPLLKNYSPLMAQLLFNRNIKAPEEAASFLELKWEDNHDPFLLFGMEKSVARIKQAIETNEKITIYADYDADGIPGSVVLKKLFEKIGYENVDIYIPHRHDEGYGIHLEALEKIAESGTTLVISIDVGITGFEAGVWCKENNIDLIITDHHLPLREDGSDILPEALSVINPKQENCSYPDPMLCGAGVIFKLVQAFIANYGEEYAIPKGWEKWLLGFVGISTISDLVPLRNENRIFAHFGMKVIQKICQSNNHFLGLKELVWSSGINHRYLTEDDIGFSITPKINASSRMSHPEDAVAVLLAEDEHSARKSVDHLTQLNNERKKRTKQMTNEALSMIEHEAPENIILVGKNDWSAGIIGLVASKLVEHYHLPSFVWSEEDGILRGSCRSIDGIHLVELMQSIPKGILLGFGGHKEAGGFSLLPEKLELFEKALHQALSDYTEKNTQREESVRNIDMELSVDEINLHNYGEVRALAPFGMENPKPLFSLKEISIEEIKTFGKEQNHLEIFFKNSLGKTLRGICFFKTPSDFPRLTLGSSCEILAHLEYSVFMGKHELRLHIVDIL